MKKLIFCISLSLTGLMTACVDKNEAVDADSKPSWLGGSIYQELKNPSNLEGEFKTYLRLIDDLGEAETLNRTGSKTVFPANDEAFARFFQSNEWGVTSYEQLTVAQKQQLLYGSMLDNAMLINMLSNVSGSGASTISPDIKALKHSTNLQVVATVQHMDGSQLPKNNAYWDPYRSTGIYVVSDASQPMMMHFTREFMLKNNITTKGDNSDFAILTGSPYREGNAYVFNVGVHEYSDAMKAKTQKDFASDVICLNGYIHQMEDVVVPPGNMTQILREDPTTTYASRLVDYFSAPFKNELLTSAYNGWAIQNDQPEIPMIYEVKYLNKSKNHSVDTDPDDNPLVDERATARLDFDPGWNQYSPQEGDNAISDAATFFVPTDEAFEKFFLGNGDGAYLINLYGRYRDSENTKEHLAENLDSLYQKAPVILTNFLQNLMKQSVINNVPSKFSTIKNDASDYMGVDTTILARRANGTYDIKIANNGVIYKMNEMIAPDKYRSVMAPSSVYPDLSVMRWAVDDDEQLGLSFHFYLMAMKSNFAFFVPDNDAFGRYYVDPTHLAWTQPRALRFSYEGDTIVTAEGTEVRNVGVRCRAYEYDPETNTVGNVLNSGTNIPVAQWKTLFQDILNFHTVVLDVDGAGNKATIGSNGNKYYKTKHGGEIYVTGNTEGCEVMSGQQIDNNMASSKITRVYNQDNGQAFRIDHVIEPPRNSVYKTLQNHDCFAEFHKMCDGFSNAEVLSWAGISNMENSFHTTEQDAYIIFTSDRGSVSQSCLDQNVKMFNTYNYTLYAPNNEAMALAYAAGLPTWEMIADIIEQTNEQYNDGLIDDNELANKQAEVKAMIDKMRDFVRYHFQSTSIYADNVVESGRFGSLGTDQYGLAVEMEVGGGSGKLEVKDVAGVTHVIDANDRSQHNNLMARDYWFNGRRDQATSIYTTSFCAVHELRVPLFTKSQENNWMTNMSLNDWIQQAKRIYNN